MRSYRKPMTERVAHRCRASTQSVPRAGLAGLDSVLPLASGARWSPIPRHSLVAGAAGAPERDARDAPDSPGLGAVAGGHDQLDSVLAFRAEPDRAMAAPAGASASGAVPAVAHDPPAGGIRQRQACSHARAS